MIAMLIVWFGAAWIQQMVKLDPTGFKPVTLPPPMSISPIVLLLIGVLFLGFCGLRRKK